MYTPVGVDVYLMDNILAVCFYGCIAVAVVLWFRRARTTSKSLSSYAPLLVLTKFDVDEEHGRVLIAGRPGGVVDWLLSKMRLQSKTTLSASWTDIRLRTASLFGEHDSVVATASVSSSHCGIRQPFGLLIVAALLFLTAVIAFLVNLDDQGLGLMLLFSAPAVGCVWFYVLMRAIEISLETQGGAVLRIRFRASVIENVRVDLESARRAIAIISNAIVATQGTVGKPQNLAAPSRTSRCGNCGKTYAEDMQGKYCDNCGAAMS